MRSRSTIFALLAGAMSLFGAEDVHLGRAASTSIPLISAQPDDTADLRAIETTVPIGKNGSVRGYLYAVFDARSKRFWWTFSQEASEESPEVAAKQFVERYRLAKDDRQITAFTASGRSLWHRVSAAKADSMEDGIKSAVALLPGECSKFAAGSGLWFQQANLSTALGLEFFRPKEFGDTPRGLSLVNVRPADSGWQIELQGERSQTATVAIDRLLQRVTRIGR
jgi:hypothetical protein